MGKPKDISDDVADATEKERSSFLEALAHSPRGSVNLWYWVTRMLLVILPTLITAYFSYRSAKVEADAKASAGYSTLLQSQQDLQKAFSDHLKADEQHTSELGTEVRLLKEMVLRLYSADHGTRPRAAPASASAAPVGALGHASKPSAPMFAPYQAKELPPTLDAAANMMQQSAAKK